MGYKVIVNEYSNLQGLNSTKVLVSEYAAIGTKTTKVIVIEDTNIGSSAYQDAKQASEAAMIAANHATTVLANAVQNTGATMTGDLIAPNFLLSGSQGTEPNSVTSKDYVDTELSKKVDVVDNYKEIIEPSEVITFDLSSGVNFFSSVLTNANTSVNIINVDNKPNNYQSFSFSLKQGTGANIVSWPSNILWSFGRKPVLTFTQGKIDIFQLITYDNGLTWFGSLIIAGA
ncbi:hypothetical protein [Aeromonas caviae]|uniref:hypothetical protein n=1 Tax=Aeromonas caviae TaxID=648 RepID=UPI003F7436C0